VLPGILALALGLRLWVVLTQTYIVHPDETFQYLEPAHRLVFGTGVIAWEYIDGIRNWLLPGVVAGTMGLVSIFSDNPWAYVVTLRLLCVLASLAVPYAGYRIARQAGGAGAGLIAGLLCALSPQAIYLAPVILTEPLATDAALMALAIGAGAGGRIRPSIAAGLLAGLACALRYQFAPAIVLAALWQQARDRRALAVATSAATLVVVLILGVLDAATWGAPFQSVWLNYLRNGPEGVSQAIGAEPWYFYPWFVVGSWLDVLPLAAGALVPGVRRAPVLAVLAAVIVGSHMIPAHKEIRFVFPAVVALPILIGLGLDEIVRVLPQPWSGIPTRIAVAALFALAAADSARRYVMPPAAWHLDRSLLQATEAARTLPGVCGLGVRSIRLYRSGGYSYWNRDVPLIFEQWYPAQLLRESDFRLRIDGVFHGRRVPQYAAEEMPGHTAAFNAMIGLPGDILPGYAVQSCFGAGTSDDRTICLFARPGGCG